jgi:hypothetical protein
MFSRQLNIDCWETQLPQYATKQKNVYTNNKLVTPEKVVSQVSWLDTSPHILEKKAPITFICSYKT